jgi:hypothetical protein
MLTYRDLTNAQRRALDRFVRSHDMEVPASNWPELGPADVTALLASGLLEKRGRDAQNEQLFRVTDDGIRVHDDMWKDGKVPSHPRTDPFDPQTLDD